MSTLPEVQHLLVRKRETARARKVVLVTQRVWQAPTEPHPVWIDRIFHRAKKALKVFLAL